MMTLREYAEAVAKEVNGTVEMVDKTNGIKLTGVVVDNGTNIRPCVYADSFYNEGKDVSEMVDFIKGLNESDEPKSDVLDIVNDYEKAKPYITLRLLNDMTNAEVSFSAATYGFPDLIIVPYVSMKRDDDGNFEGTKINKNLLDAWGVTKDDIFKVGLENAKANIKFMTMRQMLIEQMGLPEFLVPEDTDAPNMYVMTNTDMFCGAINVIAGKETIKEVFKNGYVVLPSSIHECIVIDADDDLDALRDMVKGINATTVDAVDQLSDRVYKFEA